MPFLSLFTSVTSGSFVGNVSVGTITRKKSTSKQLHWKLHEGR
jgi:hypothetical protein